MTTTTPNLRLLSLESSRLLSESQFNGEAPIPEDLATTDFVRDVSLEPLTLMVEEAMNRFSAGPAAASDSWLAPRVHATLRLTPREAADPRIWAYLSVVCFPSYTRWRWGSAKGKTSRDRFLGSDVRHAISRLWWGAELTRNGPAYSATGFAFSLQDIPSTWFSLDLAHHRPLALGALRAMEGMRGGKLPDGTPVKRTKKVNMLATAMNLVAKSTLFDLVLPWRGDSADALTGWISEKPDARDYLDAVPVGPPQAAVSEEEISEAVGLVSRVAMETGLLHDDSDDDLETLDAEA